MSVRRSTIPHVLAGCLALGGLAIAALSACEGMPTSTAGATGAAEAMAEPTMAWSQQAVTQLAGKLAADVSQLYTDAIKEPSFAGEHTAFGKTLQQLRALQEEVNGLHADLQAGKDLEATRDRFADIGELKRDLQVDASWDFVPSDLAAEAKTTLAALDQLDAYYGAPR